MYIDLKIIYFILATLGCIALIYIIITLSNLNKLIKNSNELVIDNKNNIATILSNNIIEHLKGLSNKLKEEIKDIFEGTLEDIALDKSVVEQAEREMTKVHDELTKKNEELEILMKFVDIEVLKYTKQLENNLVYDKSICYNIF